ncbi:UDP-N-acetylglucosamine 1-carboxyvinyltransferase [Anaerovorax odorimutans]|uniref:UDP-N-acetylglucosamine 1-carboxyvinyltransferase n=1 Tax=Anaerovorax odorimutans TaxID=109327 RepID=UPI0003F9D610|nr:UDP-N-acetylglucosamine 1-carboxyvinyltransferase [Anaerovorax odorimutans]
MDSYQITGGKKLQGEITLSGAKNAVLPILAATIITGKESKLDNCPNLSDVKNMTTILRQIGCKVKKENGSIIIDSKDIHTLEIPEKLMREMRSSVFLMGPMIARFGKAILSYPGGCEIGLRPIDIHLSALQQLGVKIKEDHGYLECTAEKLVGNRIALDFPSVGATENTMMAAACAEGETIIVNAAKEPEIIDLQNYLNNIGAQVKGAGTSEIVINGRNSFHDVTHSVISDRIECGTFLAAAAMTGGEILIRNSIPKHMIMTVSKLRETGCKIDEGKDWIYLKAPEKLNSIEIIKTQPYPGFPTDMQSQMLSVLTIAKGTSLIVETIFENRFKQVNNLKSMGAKIVVDGRSAVVTGVESLEGATVSAKDLRGGAALVIAGLGANGTTIVENVCHIDRGYDDFDETLRKLGADIFRV